MTRADGMAVRAALTHERVRNMYDREIAEIVGVSDKTVGAIRKAEPELRNFRNDSKAPATTRISKPVAVDNASKFNGKAWPARGPLARGWGEFLMKHGIEERTARRYMELAGHVEVSDTRGDESETPRHVPTYAEAGIDRRPRKADLTRPCRTCPTRRRTR